MPCREVGTGYRLDLTTTGGRRLRRTPVGLRAAGPGSAASWTGTAGVATVAMAAFMLVGPRRPQHQPGIGGTADAQHPATLAAPCVGIPAPWLGRLAACVVCVLAYRHGIHPARPRSLPGRARAADRQAPERLEVLDELPLNPRKPTARYAVHGIAHMHQHGVTRCRDDTDYGRPSDEP